MRSSFARIGLVTVLALGVVVLLPEREAEARRGPRAAHVRGGHRGHGYPAAARHYRPGYGRPAAHRGWGVRRGPVVRYRGAPRWHVYAPPPPPIYYPVPRVRVVIPAPPVVVVPAPRVYRYVPAEPAPEEHFHEHEYEQQPGALEGAPEEGYEGGYEEYDEGQPGEQAPDGGWEQPAPLPEEPDPHWGPEPTTPAPTGPATPPPTSGADVLTAAELQRIEGEILGLVNAERTKRGLEPLSPEPRLGWAAAQHSGEMYSLDYFAHESPVEGNQSFTDRMGKAGLKDFGSAAENIVMAGNSPEVARRLVQMWLDSPAHLENILRPEFRFTGVGVFGDGEKVYATQLFASDVD